MRGLVSRADLHTASMQTLQLVIGHLGRMCGAQRINVAARLTAIVSSVGSVAGFYFFGRKGRGSVPHLSVYFSSLFGTRFDLSGELPMPMRR